MNGKRWNRYVRKIKPRGKMDDALIDLMWVIGNGLRAAGIKPQ